MVINKTVVVVVMMIMVFNDEGDDYDGADGAGSHTCIAIDRAEKTIGVSSLVAVV